MTALRPAPPAIRSVAFPGVLVMVVGWLLAGCIVPSIQSPPIYVERRVDGLYVLKRSCFVPGIRQVEVRVYGRTDIEWSARLHANHTVMPEVELFSGRIAGYEVDQRRRVPGAGPYEVTVNPGYDESQIVISPAIIPVGYVQFGGGDPVSKVDYERMPDYRFGCP